MTRSSDTDQHDIAMFKVSPPFRFNDKIKPVTLPTKKEKAKGKKEMNEIQNPPDYFTFHVTLFKFKHIYVVNFD